MKGAKSRLPARPRAGQGLSASDGAQRGKPSSEPKPAVTRGDRRRRSHPRRSQGPTRRVRAQSGVTSTTGGSSTSPATAPRPHCLLVLRAHPRVGPPAPCGPAPGPRGSRPRAAARVKSHTAPRRGPWPARQGRPARPAAPPPEGLAAGWPGWGAGRARRTPGGPRRRSAVPFPPDAGVPGAFGPSGGRDPGPARAAPGTRRMRRVVDAVRAGEGKRPGGIFGLSYRSRRFR